MKYLILLIMLGINSSIFSYTVNHGSKLYGVIGSGTIWLTGGLGFSYTPEFTVKPEDQIIQVLTVDTQFLGLLNPVDFSFNLIGTYGVGYRFNKGYRLVVDIFGVGVNLRSGYSLSGGGYRIPVGMIFNFPGFQFTLANGFYVAWRNNFSVGNFTEFKTYFAIGFDFSKMYNPNYYKAR